MDYKNVSIREIRKALGLSQKQVVDHIGMSMRALQSWEYGERKCPDYIEKLIVAELVRWAGEKPDFGEK